MQQTNAVSFSVLGTPTFFPHLFWPSSIDSSLEPWLGPIQQDCLVAVAEAVAVVVAEVASVHHRVLQGSHFVQYEF